MFIHNTERNSNVNLSYNIKISRYIFECFQSRLYLGRIHVASVRALLLCAPRTRHRRKPVGKMQSASPGCSKPGVEVFGRKLSLFGLVCFGVAPSLHRYVTEQKLCNVITGELKLMKLSQRNTSKRKTSKIRILFYFPEMISVWDFGWCQANDKRFELIVYKLLKYGNLCH